MKKKISLGISDFKKFVELDSYLVDKSLLIKDVIKDTNQIILLPRPRRFGKTLNISMLKYFFEHKIDEKKSNKNLFNGLKIEKESEFKKHFKKYPVVYLTFKDIKDLTFEEAYKNICDIISSVYKNIFFDYSTNLLLDESEKNYISNIIDETASEKNYKKSLSESTKLLKKIYNKEVVLLIDEYDTPIHTAYQNGYYNEMITFMQVFLSKALKDNANVFKSVLTGILRVSKESIFSGLNSLGVYSITSYNYSAYFGFNETEVKELLKYFKKENLFEDIKEWYDGYQFGDEKIYNPWSVLNYTAKPRDGLLPYWVNTASNTILRELIKNGDVNLRDDIKLLLEGKELEKRHLNDNIAFGDLRNERNHAISFLYYTGHLTYTKCEMIKNKYFYNLKVPNVEVSIIYEDIIQNWLSDAPASSDLNKMLEVLLIGEIDIFEEKFNEYILDTLSYFDVNKKNEEAVYQAFMLGILLNLKDRYRIKSNAESGLGRYDICLIPKDKSKTGIIMELKKKLKKYTVEKVLNDALKQIEEKKYETELLSFGIKNILKIAVTFDGKKCWLKTG
jgi:hypothetical protein